MGKPKVAFYWCCSCGGCEESVVDLNEDILKVAAAVDIVFWPVALDFKYKDLEAMKDGEIAVSFINGAVRLQEQKDIAELLRKKSRLIVAHGSCAHLGGVPGLANLFDRKSVLEKVYTKTPSTINPEKIVPLEKVNVKEGELELPRIFDTVSRLDQVIKVDYYLPGCPPPPDLIMKGVNAVLSGELPPRGSVIGPKKSLCEDCSRKESKPDKLSIDRIKRIHLVLADPQKCFLAEGLICLGPATRSGCGEKCIKANMPCRGCFGPADNVFDQGGKFLSALASIVDLNDEEDIKKIVDSVADMTGTFYRFSLPSSLLNRKKMEVSR